MSSTEVLSGARRAPIPVALLALPLLGMLIMALATDPARWARLRERTAHLGAMATAAAPRPPFSASAKDEEFLATSPFVEPLVPVGRTSPAENRALARALEAYASAFAHGDVDDVGALESFLEDHPQSPWRPSLLLGLGGLYRSTGHVAKALGAWTSAWEASKTLDSPNGRTVGDEAAGYLSQLEAYLGRKESLAPLLEEVRARPVHGSAAQRIENSSEGLDDMLHRPGISFKCGPLALQRILLSQSRAPNADSMRALDFAESTPNGLSLTAVQAISVKAAMNYRMAFRPRGTPIVTPSVMHWGVGHFAAILGQDPAGRYVVGDATFGEDLFVREATIDEDASGYFLIPPGPLPDGWREVSEAEGNTVWGRGNTGDNHDDGATNPSDVKAFPCKDKGGPCAIWNAEASVVSLSMHDDPVGYTPALGPAIRFPVDYSYRDVSQPGTFPYSNMGYKWTFGWLSYVQDDPTCAGAYGTHIQTMVASGAGGSTVTTIVTTTVPPGAAQCAKMYRRGGGTEEFAFSPNTATTSGLSPTTQSLLTRTLDANNHSTGFTRTLSDGSVETFTQPVNASGATEFLLTKITDPHNQSVTINYLPSTAPDGGVPATTRISTITDALNQSTTFCYSDSTASACAGAPAPPLNTMISRIVDPFGRFATFTYDTAYPYHLLSITDAINITSSFLYQSGTDFIQTLTTPYGATTFTFGDASSAGGNLSGGRRFLKVIDTGTAQTPWQRMSYVEFNNGFLTGAVGQGHCGIDYFGGPPNRYPAPVESTANPVDPTTGLSCSDPAGLPGGLLQTISPEYWANDNLIFRNTFVWEPYQYEQAGGTATTPPTVYTDATILHWLHTDATNSQTHSSGILESVKPPLENRIWFNYAAQNTSQLGPLGIGVTNQPTAIARIVPVGSGSATTTQLLQTQYDYMTSAPSPHGKITQVTDPIGRQTTFTYAANGFDLTSISNTSNGIHDLQASFSNYNALHEPQTFTGANGYSWNYTYYTNGLLHTATDTLQHMWTYVRDPASAFLSEVDGPPQTIPRYVYTPDAVGRVRTATGPTGVSVTYAYDNADRLTSKTFLDGTTMLFGYNLLDLISVTDRLGRTTKYSYDADRELYEIDEPTSPTGSPPARSTFFAYYKNKAINTLKDPNTNVTTYKIDLEGRQTEEDYADGTASNTIFDLAGRVSYIQKGKTPSTLATSITQGAAGTILLAYNVDDTLQSVVPSSDVPPTNYYYDGNYRRVYAWQQGTSLNSGGYTYYPVGTLGANLVHTDSQVFANPVAGNANGAFAAAVSYSYDAMDRRTYTQVGGPVALGTQPNTNVQYADSRQYDALGRLTSDTNALDFFTYTYNDASGRVSGRTSFVGGPAVSYAYYPANQDGVLEAITYSVPNGGPVEQYFAYSYDAAHNVNFTAAPYLGSPSGLSYQYDQFNEIQGVTDVASGHANESYSYDPNGNIKSASGLAWEGALTGLTYNSVNKINTTETYDNDGNRIRSALNARVFTSTFDGLDRVTSIAMNQSPSLRSSFAYDGLSRLVQVKDSVGGLGRVNQFYVQCDDRPCLALDGMSSDSNGVPPVSRVYVNQGMAVMQPQAKLYYYMTDALGSVREVVDNTSPNPVVIDQYNYDSFGNPKLVGGNKAVVPDFGFAGYFQHANRLAGDNQMPVLDFARSRAYAPFPGRWLSRDPLERTAAFMGGDGFNATDLTRYAYVRNNGLAFVDPNGLFGYGASLGGSLESGFGDSGGIAAQGSVSAGHFFDQSNGFSFTNELFMTTGAFLGGGANPLPSVLPEGIQPGGRDSVIGASVGAGLSGFITNARTVAQLEGPFRVLNVNIGFGPIKVSGSLAWGNGVYELSVGIPLLSDTAGASISAYDTVTEVLGKAGGCPL